MSENIEILIFVGVIVLLLFVVAGYMSRDTTYVHDRRRHMHRNRRHHRYYRNENFKVLQQMDGVDTVQGNDPEEVNNEKIRHPRESLKDNESLIFDNTTGAIMTGSQFMEETGIITPPWVAPAWNPDELGPASKGELNPEDYENDPRMLYNKCSLSCCSPQYPTPFQGPIDPFVCGKDGKNKYLASSYICQNNTGGTGCLCMTQKQVDGMENNFVNY
jgi:hypothetical protein